MDTQEEIKKLKKRIAELELVQEFPQQDNTYWYVSMRGNIFTSQWEGFPSELAMLKLGNIFKTEEQAEFATEKLKVEEELRKFSKPFKCGEINQYIFLDTDRDRIDVENRYYFPTQGTTYFDSKEKVLKAIQSVGEERIKKYIFGVGE